ncbi:member of major facilitator superfamily multidrug-resistance protein [Paracoccidioides lutzii Pb01]|uniref:Member of major facilitator superfamily multidrug-resistance protein n=1 Tax=Paracoccidioides lutzii (strain ATCC MYA-826 / Pb01) TaxID=502779 RepID=C1GQI3_PARBA|nr:member of major facilitator superfamily multidrug-resistance protein [Paracoccidioides lutzii Pb01]EEH37857.2 member of major facilitator superfamily multidrug-resistance protein [Paracoccidioides lutzii Pb01]
MGLGILEDSRHEHVPGTSFILDDDSSTSEQLGPIPTLKYDRSGPVPIILVPQPSDDPNDPLNWPLHKRDTILAILSLASVFCATTSPLLAANTATIAIGFRISFTKAALLTGYHLCGVGVAGLLFVPSARVWGKRHLYLLGCVIMIVSSAWGGASRRSYTSLLWARIFQGIGLAPFEALVNASVGDLFYVHERGKRMALSNVALFGGCFLTPVIVGKLTASLGWEWSFYLLAIFSGVCLPFLVFFVPETAFRRPDHFNTDIEGETSWTRVPKEAPTTTRQSGDESKEEHEQDQQLEQEQNREQEAKGDDSTSNGYGIADAERATAAPNTPSKTTYWQTLKPFNGRKTDESYWKLLLRPIPLFFHPGILWACLIQGVLIGWTVFIGVVLAAIFLGPPLWFTEVETGYLYTGAFVGSICGLLLSGLLSDWSAKLLIKLNKGVYEPEFRIVLVLFQLVFGCIGLYGFAFASSDVAKYGYVVPDVFFAFIIVGMVMGAVASALYVVDAHRQIAVEAFTCLLVFKNMFSFILTYFAYDWVVLANPRTVFLTIGSVQVCVCLLSIPMYIFGKRNRSYFHRHDILKMLNLW